MEPCARGYLLPQTRPKRKAAPHSAPSPQRGPRILHHPAAEAYLVRREAAPPRTAMELMRHPDIRLTTNIYQHLELVETTGAVNSLLNIRRVILLDGHIENCH